ncbi:MAG: hypothetical protein ACRCVY_09825 [Commensalibacter sp.]
MVFPWLKKLCNQVFSNEERHLQIKILQNPKGGKPVDFICKRKYEKVICQFDLSEVLKEEETITSIQSQAGDSQLNFDQTILQGTQFTTRLAEGTLNSKSGIAFTVTTQTNRTFQITVLLVVKPESSYDKETDKSVRDVRLWSLGRNPDERYVQPGGEAWINGDMVLNETNRHVWEYNSSNGTLWKKLLVLNGPAQPVITPETETEKDEKLVDVKLQSVYSDQGKIVSDGNGALTLNGNLQAKQCNAAFNSIVVGNPLGQGISFAVGGMLSGQSLFISAPDSRPKNCYVGVSGCVSTKMLSTDYLQLAALSVEELPKDVPMGTVVLCLNYPETSKPEILIALKDQPSSHKEWALIAPSSGNAKPYLKSVPSIPSEKAEAEVVISTNTNNVVEIKPTLTPVKSDLIQSYTHIQLIQLSLKGSRRLDIFWNRLHPGEKVSVIKGDGYKSWQYDTKEWKAPFSGLMHVNAWVIFAEEEMEQRSPTSYHAGDRLIFNVAVNGDAEHNRDITKQNECPLIPYINDVTHKICINGRISCTMAFPVEKGDLINFNMAYLSQEKDKNNIPSIRVERGGIEFYVQPLT